MEILLQLGANETAFIQFIIFIVTITFLTTVVFAPFFKAYDQRRRLTVGADQVAFETQDEAKKLAQIYQSRAREINEKINKLFETSRGESLKSCSIILDAAKTNVTQTTDVAQKQMTSQKLSAAQQVKTIAGEVSTEIVKKLMGSV